MHLCCTQSVFRCTRELLPDPLVVGSSSFPCGVQEAAEGEGEEEISDCPVGSIDCACLELDAVMGIMATGLTQQEEPVAADVKIDLSKLPSQRDKRSLFRRLCLLLLTLYVCRDLGLTCVDNMRLIEARGGGSLGVLLSTQCDSWFKKKQTHPCSSCSSCSFLKISYLLCYASLHRYTDTHANTRTENKVRHARVRARTQTHSLSHTVTRREGERERETDRQTE